MQKLLVIIPAYNEEKSILSVVVSIKKEGYDYIVVNDCSTDNTSRVLSENNLNHLNLPINLGIGGAMQTGYKYAAKNNYDWAVQVDGDGQHVVSEIKKLIEVQKTTKANLVIGSRFVADTGYKGNVTRRIGIAVFALVTKILAGQSIKDATSGFRLADKEIIRYFANNYPSDYPEPEVLVPLKKMGYKIIETPVKILERKEGVSSISPLKSAYYMVKVIFAMIITKIGKT